ncbi:MAG TPA: response regulator [Dongiaceae bacterium]|jgi:CheY-like chemotaxis protein|nr:response regulator [Dongiaceae bacterium]
MPDVSEKIVENLRYLRRYARALVGSQQAGDTYVRICLEDLLQEPDRISANADVRLQLFRLFHDVWSRAGAPDSEEGSEPRDLSVEARLQALPISERQMLLLTTLEGFSVQDASQILGLSHEEGADLLASAWSSVNEQMATSILVIEDEPVIALDIVGLVRDMGHSVVGIASSQIEAVRLAQKSQPGLVLADIDLGPGGSGLTAVKEILDSMKVPVIFVTAYPERLLTGERPEPTYLVTKPFEPDTLKVTISQALSFFGQPRQSRQAV